MTRSRRTEVALATAALCAASFLTDLFLFFTYLGSHPTKPNAALGFVRALNNHGSYVYLTDTESTGLVLLGDVFFVGFFAAFAILPKDPSLAPPGTARWLAHLYVAKDNFGDNSTPRQKAVFLCALLFYLAVIWLAGPILVRFMVSRGIVWWDFCGPASL
jgi:hypothetical protein